MDPPVDTIQPIDVPSLAERMSRFEGFAVDHFLSHLIDTPASRWRAWRINSRAAGRLTARRSFSRRHDGVVHQCSPMAAQRTGIPSRLNGFSDRMVTGGDRHAVGQRGE
jgi:hypothetical protein